MPERIRVLDCPVDPLSMEETVARCDELIRTGGPHQHMAVNVAKLVAARDDERLRTIIEHSAIVNADGQGVVWAAKLLGQDLPGRVAGIDLMHELVALAAQRGYRVYFLGAKADVLERAIGILRERHPALQVAGHRDGYFAAEEEAAVCAAIAAARADILFVAMGTPRKETFLAEHADVLGVPLLVGVGGAVDVLAGVTRRAPAVWQRAGLEWLYRLLQEPRRMVRRYATSNARFAVMLAGAMAGRLSGRSRSEAC